MKLPHPLKAAAFLVLGAAANPAWAQGRATVQLLPTLGGPASEATGLNDQGQVVGWSLDAQAVRRAFVWSAGGGMQAITAGRGEAMAINAQGQVVGWDSASPSGLGRPFVWDAVAGLRPLPTERGVGEARFINSQGLVGGWQRDSADLPTLWHPDGRVEQLAWPRLVGGLNEAGQVVSYSGVEAVRLWQPDGTHRVVSALYGSDRLMTATGLNNRGAFVGSMQLPGNQAPNTAYLWDAQRGLRDLGHLGGGASAASALNDAGQVVGMAAVAGGDVHAALWNPQLGLLDLNRFAPAGNTLVTARAINAHAQVAGHASNAGGDRGYLLTLHPDWTGGDGHWDDATGQRWNWAGTGTAAARVGAMHDVVINPGHSATVWGSANGSARTLRIGGTAGAIVTLDLGGGSTHTGDGLSAIYNPTVVATGGVLRGQGSLTAREDLKVEAGGRVQVDAGQAMRLDVDHFDNAGLVRAQGLATSLARLEVGGGALYNNGQIQAVHADLVFNNGLVNFGQLTLQGAQLTMARPGTAGQLFNGQGGRVGVSFGDSVINGRLTNQGLLVVSNGARASFHGEVETVGELRVSAGGSANFFAPVLLGGSLTGGGQVRFEAALSGSGGPTSAQIEPEAQIAGALRLAAGAGAHDHFGFSRAVLLDGATLELGWLGSDAAGAGWSVDLFDWDGGVTGTFAALALPTLAPGLVWDTSDLYGGGGLRIAPVPEPGSWALLAAGLLLVARRLARGGEMAA